MSNTTDDLKQAPNKRGQGFIIFIIRIAIFIGLVFGLLLIGIGLRNIIPPLVDKAKIINTDQILMLVSFVGSIVLSIVSNLLTPIVKSMVVEAPSRLVYLKERVLLFLDKPRWYKSNQINDTGLIEVSLGATAVLVAIPSSDMPFIRVLNSIGVIISIFVSISMLNRYARSRGSNAHILFDPFENGPFFFLGWSVLFALLFLGLALKG